MAMPATCPKCGQPGWGPSPKWVENKKGPKGKRYFYEVFVHKGPKARMKPCYVKSIPSSQPNKIEPAKSLHLSGAEIAFLKAWSVQEAKMRHKTKAEFLDNLIKMGESEMPSDERKINAEMEPGPLGDYVRDRVKAES